MDVVVAGAGPTGLTLACGLLRQGVGVRLVDAAPEPATTSRALVLHARGVEILDRLGTLGDLPAHTIPIERTVLHAGGQRVAELRLGEVPNATPLIASQADIEAALRATLTGLGGSIEWGTAVGDATQDDAGINVTLSRPGQDTEPLRAGWLIGCDGAHSQVRALAGIDFPGASIPERFLLADVHVGWHADRDATAGWLHRDGFMLAIPLPGAGDLWRLMADVPASASGDDLPVVERLRRLLPERTGVTGAVIGPERWTSSFRLHRRLAARYRSGRMLLAGDAAHVHSPFGGQGMNTGIGDAENLAWKLALVVQRRAEPSLLDSYETERRPVASEVLTNTTAFTRVLLGAGPITRLVRDRVAVPLAARPVIQRKAIAKASQLGVSYRRGPLATGPAIRLCPRPRPGDRIPDRRCHHADGGRTRLHAELGTGWVLLVPRGEAPDAVAEAGGLLGGRLTVLTYEQGPLQLIRPDAHLAWQGRPGNAAGLLHWLRTALMTGRVGR